MAFATSTAFLAYKKSKPDSEERIQQNIEVNNVHFLYQLQYILLFFLGHGLIPDERRKKESEVFVSASQNNSKEWRKAQRIQGVVPWKPSTHHKNRAASNKFEAQTHY